jgi:ABC-type transport system substrate-binding protein
LIARRLLILCSALAFLTAACDPSSSSSGSGEPALPSPEASSVPVRGGTAVVGVFGEPATFDPYSELASDLTYALARPVYRSLYRFDPAGAPVPDLVETLDASGDVATITLTDASWSDGTPLTSKDVEATIDRARPPSRLASIDSVQRRGPRRLVLSGPVQDWPEALARISFVLPRSGKRLFSGPFVVADRTEGLQVVLEPNPISDVVPHLDRLVVQYTEGVDLLLALLESERLDAAWLHSTVNLAQRLDELGLSHEESLGWERIILDLSGSDLTISQRRALAQTLDRRAMEKGFVRDGGRVADTLAPQPGPGGAGGPFEPLFMGNGKGGGVSLQLSAPSGDELLELIQRLAQVQLDSNGWDVELINVDARRFYGEWAVEDPVDAALRRAAGAPGAESASGVRSLATLPLFHVETVMAWGPGLSGIQVNPTLEGPLAHAHEWFLVEADA